MKQARAGNKKEVLSNLTISEFELREEEENDKVATRLRCPGNPMTSAEKLRRIKLAIKFIIRQNDDQELYYRGKWIINKIDEWCHGLGKKIATQRQEYALVMHKTLPQIVDPNKFLKYDLVWSTMDIYMVLIYS